MTADLEQTRDFEIIIFIYNVFVFLIIITKNLRQLDASADERVLMPSATTLARSLAMENVVTFSIPDDAWNNDEEKTCGCPAR